MTGTLTIKNATDLMESILDHLIENNRLHLRPLSKGEIVCQLAALHCTDEQLREVIHGRTVEAMADQLSAVSSTARPTNG